MSSTKSAPWDTEEARKARANYAECVERRRAIQRELGEILLFRHTSPEVESRRSDLLIQLSIVEATQEEMKRTLQIENDKAFSSQVRLASGRVEALECLYRVLTRYLNYRKGVNGKVDETKLDEYWEAVVRTTVEISSHHKGEA